jgi:hypothetical protein
MIMQHPFDNLPLWAGMQGRAHPVGVNCERLYLNYGSLDAPHRVVVLPVPHTEVCRNNPRSLRRTHGNRGTHHTGADLLATRLGFLIRISMLASGCPHSLKQA